MAFDKNKNVEPEPTEAEHPTPGITPAGAPEGYFERTDDDVVVIPESAPVEQVDTSNEQVDEPVVEAKTYDAAEVHAALKKAGFDVADEDEVSEGRLGPSTRAAVTEFQYSIGRGG